MEMTVQELNNLPFLELNISRLLSIAKAADSDQGELFSQISEIIKPDRQLKDVCLAELDSLMNRYREAMRFIDSIDDPWTKEVFELRFIHRKSLREIGTAMAIDAGTIKQNIYSYIALHPDGYISSRELAKRWGLNINTINAYCRRGALPGAKKIDGKQHWLIPINASRPSFVRKYVSPQKPPGYVTAKEYAQAAHVTPGYVSKLCKEGKIPGAKQIQRKVWVIPR